MDKENELFNPIEGSFMGLNYKLYSICPDGEEYFRIPSTEVLCWILF